jgi:pyruvate dehydrogenase E2 component (dihydrolipoamide acetyltransferase)
MAHILIMPRQGNTVESCVIQEWQVKEGDRVAADQAVCVVETDKAAFEVPAGAAGTVLKLLYASGDDVPVLEPIAVIGAAGEDWQAALPAPLAAAPQAPLGVAPLGAALGAAAGAVPPAASPRARKLAALEGLPLDGPATGLAGSGLAATGPGGRIIERDVRAALEGRPALTAAALAGGGLAPGAASGSGLAGRVTVAD